MSPLTLRSSTTGVFILCASLLSACEGDSRPFEESVEVQTLGLTSIEVTPPANSQAEIFINPGESIQLGLTGRTQAETSVLLPAGDRDWRSSNPAVFTVSDTGLLTGVGTVQETAEASVLIGGIESSSLSVTVSDATLSSIQSINGEDDSLERCLPSEYYAVGLFSDGSPRTLSDVSFSLNDETTASLVQTDTGTAVVNATDLGTGAVTLTAAAAGAAPFPRQLTVLDTLQSIAITPMPAAVDVGRTIDFTATGTYSGTSPTGGGTGAPPVPGSLTNSRSENITANVDWQVISGTANASVVNSGDNKGQLSGLVQGSAVLQASCGADLQPTVSVTVNDVVASDSDALSFNIDRSDNLLIIGFNETFSLEVSRGSEFDSDNLVPIGDLEFTVENEGTTDEDIDRTAINTGIIRPLAQGARVRVTAILFDSSRRVEASGSFDVSVQ